MCHVFIWQSFTETHGSTFVQTISNERQNALNIAAKTEAQLLLANTKTRLCKSLGSHRCLRLPCDNGQQQKHNKNTLKPQSKHNQNRTERQHICCLLGVFFGGCVTSQYTCTEWGSVDSWCVDKLHYNCQNVSLQISSEKSTYYHTGVCLFALALHLSHTNYRGPRSHEVLSQN